jgi:hypothetical protein
MLNYAQNIVLICVMVSVALLLVALLNYVWPTTSRKVINEVTAWQLGVLGTTYGVILGFMLYSVWQGFYAAQVDANLEATSMLNVYRLSMSLPSPQRETMQELARHYEWVVVNEEWPAMQRGQEERAASEVLSQMWKVLPSARSDDALSANSVDHIQYAMSNLAERRNMRDQQRSSQMPRLLWFLLILGGIATVVSSCLLGNDKQWLHYCQVGALAFVVVTTLAAIADLARPYDGSVAIEPYAFVRALKIMDSSNAH